MLKYIANKIAVGIFVIINAVKINTIVSFKLPNETLFNIANIEYKNVIPGKINPNNLLSFFELNTAFK